MNSWYRKSKEYKILTPQKKKNKISGYVLTINSQLSLKLDNIFRLNFQSLIKGGKSFYTSLKKIQSIAPINYKDSVWPETWPAFSRFTWRRSTLGPLLLKIPPDSKRIFTNLSQLPRASISRVHDWILVSQEEHL